SYHMDVEITIKNYRCFSDEKPARLLLRNGFTAFVGPNNSGKSSLLKFFYEFRNLFALFSAGGNAIGSTYSATPFALAPSIQDTNEFFCNLNSRDLEIELR